MLKSSNVRDALADLIKTNLPLKVFFNTVNNAAYDYCWIRLRPKHKNIGQGYFERRLRVDFQIVLSPNDAAQVKHTDLLDIIDTLDEVTCKPLQIDDRFITIYDAESIIFDNILTYSFELDFADCLSTLPNDIARAEFMQQLELNLNEGE